MLEFITQYLTSVVTALSVMGATYLLFWVILGKPLGKRKIQLSKRAGWPQIREEIVATIIALLGNTAFVSIILSFKDKGLTKFYLGGSFGWYEALTVLVMVLVSDAWFYWCHRAMHHPRVYKYVHALHHKSLDVNPFTSNSFHMVEVTLLTVWILPLVMVMPVSMTALGITQAIGLFNNLKSHLGFELFPSFFSTTPPFNMLVTATNHSLHHTQYNGNYGLFFRFWDMACGTELNSTTRTFDEIHSRKNRQVIDNTRYRDLRIDRIVRETSKTVSVYFRPTDHDFYHYMAGQYLTLKVKVGGRTYDRCFSLSSSPGVDDFLRITVKLKGEVSHYFHHDARVGDVVRSLLPVGDFTLPPDPSVAKHHVMVAGGSGITPLYSMIRQVLHVEPRSKVTLLYANRREEDIIFKKGLDLLAEKHPQFTYKDFISGKGRIVRDDLAFDGEPQYYLCGPDGMKEDIAAQLRDLKVKPSNIHVEHFVDGYLPWFGLFAKIR